MNIEIISSSFMLGFAILLKDIFKNLFAGIWIYISPEFRKGDKVKFEKYEGVIEKFCIRNIHIRLESGGLLIKETSSFLELDIIRHRR